MTLPLAVRPFIEFPAILRQNGFAVSPDQCIGLIEAVGLLGPRSIEDIHRASIAMLAIPHERRAEFDALFRAYFMGQAISAPAEGDEDEDVTAHEPEGGTRDIDAPDDENEAGETVVTAERLSQRQFKPADESRILTEFRRSAPNRLPCRMSYRRAAASHGDRLDMRKTLREAVRRDGEIVTLTESRRKTRQRRILVLIDVSGSMQDQTDGTIRLAHALVQAADRAEVFTFGTRLTRITPALKLSRGEAALARVGRIVADFDGGTRIGDALAAFLAIPRFAGMARGAAVLVLSDGLERDDPTTMIDTVARLSRLAWRLSWLTPLASDTGFAPRTAGLQAVLPWLYDLADGSNVAAISSHILNLAQTA